MNKPELINNVVNDMLECLNGEQAQRLKVVLSVRLSNVDLVASEYLPCTEVKDNDWILNRYRVDCLASGTKPSTVKFYLYVIKSFFDFTKLSYNQVTGQYLTDYIAIKQYTKTKNGNYPSVNYIVTIQESLFVFYKWAFRKHHIDTDISVDIDKLKSKRKKKDRLTLEEIESCRDAVSNDPCALALFELMLSTGMRVGEIAQLRTEDINFTTREIHIRGYKSETSDRIGYLSIKARNAIQKYLGIRSNCYVFIPSKNIHREHMSTETLEHIAIRIGLLGNAHVHTNIHVFRKTFASEMYRKTKNVKLVSILLGHSDTRVTEQVYLVDDMADIKSLALQAA